MVIHTPIGHFFVDFVRLVHSGLSSNGKYNNVFQNCIVTKITSVKTEEHVMKMSIINTGANVSLALTEDTVKQVSSVIVWSI